MLTTDATVLHVRFDGRSEEFDLKAMNLGPDVTDAELRSALAQRYDCAVAELDGYVVVREPQAIIVRPMAFYG